MANKIFLPHERDEDADTEEAPPETALNSKQRQALDALRALLDSVCNADEATVRELAAQKSPRFVVLMREAIEAELPKPYLKDLSARMKSAME